MLAATNLPIALPLAHAAPPAAGRDALRTGSAGPVLRLRVRRAGTPHRAGDASFVPLGSLATVPVAPGRAPAARPRDHRLRLRGASARGRAGARGRTAAPHRARVGR
jgi:hypothetical protein